MKLLSPAAAPAWVASQLAVVSGTRWIGVDGFGAAGKSTLAARIAAAVPGAEVIGVDNFARTGLAGWDIQLFQQQVVDPLLAGRAGRYRRWDWVADSGLDWVEVPPGVPVIVEGVSSIDSRVQVPWDLTLWVAAPMELRQARIAERDGPALATRWRDDWWPSERAYASAQRPWHHVDAIVAESGGSGPDCEGW